MATDEAADQLLWDCLAEIPFLQTQKVEQRILREAGRPDIMAHVRTPAGPKVLLVQIQDNGQTRLVREAIGEILKYRETYADAYGVVMVPHITPRAAGLCKQEGIGYLDFSGNALLSFDSVFVSKTGRSVVLRKRKGFRSWFSPRAERVVRGLLMHPGRLWKIQELANEAMVTPYQALTIKNLLAQRQWVQDEPQGFRLVRPDLLLDEWSSNYLPRRTTERRFASSKTVLELETALAAVCKEQCIPYALMGYSAAMRFDPFLHHSGLSAYVLSDLSKIISALELSEASKNGNVSLRVPYDEAVLLGVEQFDHARVTSPLQTYLDLINADGRGEKIAYTVFQSFIKPKWQTQPAAAPEPPEPPPAA